MQGNALRRSMFTSLRSSGTGLSELKPVFCSVAPQTPIWPFRTPCAEVEHFVSHFHKLLRISTAA